MRIVRRTDPTRLTRVVLVLASAAASSLGPAAASASGPPVYREISTASSTPTAPAALAGPATTLLDLRFEGNPNGEAGETPTIASGITFETGAVGSGANLAPGNQLKYASGANIDAASGSVEFWIKPSWDGSDGLDHYALRYGVSGGILIGKDGGNFWRIILNRFGGAGGSELGSGIFINDWVANQWHYAAFTWSPTAINVYVDGVLKATASPSAAPPSISDTDFQIGADGTAGFLDGVIDEVLVSSGERTADEILTRYLGSLTVSALAASPDTLHAFPTWRLEPPTLTATTNMGTVVYPASAATWSSTDPTVAEYDATLGKMRILSAGQAQITATVNGVSANILLQVRAPVLPPVHENIAAFLQSPADSFRWEVPVVVIRYLPTADGINLDTSVNPDYYDLGPISLAELKARIDTFDGRVKFGLEEGSRYHSYSNRSRPSLGYRVVDYITVYEPTPPGKVLGQSGGYPIYDADYFSIFERFDIAHLVNYLGVKEIWFWSSGFDASYPSYDPSIQSPESFRASWESNMSSPVTGDVSNSNRDNTDLPVHNHTYTLYGYNFRRSQAEALHNHGHQIEALFSHAAIVQDGNSDLFWKQFAGQDQSGEFITGRCGWTHMPPNTTVDYDYLNPALVSSDIEDWNPDHSGVTKLVNVDTWGSLTFAWPDGLTEFAQRKETQWYIYWWQNVPGYANTIRLGSDYIANWWMFVGDWDGSVAQGQGLHTPSAPTGVAVTEGGTGEFGLRLDAVVPNPTLGSAALGLDLGRSGHVRVDVVDVHGRRVRTLLDAVRPAGRQSVSWDGRSDNGLQVGSGVYWLVGSMDGTRAARRVVMVR